MDKLEYIFENTKIGIAICSAENNILELVNPAFANIHGYEPHELIGISPAQVFAPECMLKLGTDTNKSLCMSDDISFESVHNKKDGSFVDVSVHITVIKDEAGNVLHRIANIQDITEKKREREKLQESEAKRKKIETQFTSLGSIIPDLIWMKDINGFYVDCNSAFESFFSTSKESIIGKTDYDFFNKEAADFCKQTDIEAISTGTINISQETFIVPEDKTTGIMEVRKVPIMNDKKVVGVLGIGRDITQRITHQQQLLKMEYFLKHIKEGVYLVTENGTFEYVNEEACKLLGYTKEELLSSSVQEIDKEYSADMWSNHWEHIKTHGSQTLERLHVRKDGAYFPVEIHANYFLFENKSYNLAIVRDISQKKQQEEMLFRKEKELAALADHLPGFVYTYRLLADKREEFLYVSKGVRDVYGISPQDALNNIGLVREVIHPDDIANFRAAIVKSAQTLDIFHVEFRVNHPLKGELWLESKATPETRFPDGSIVWHGITLDITERKKNERIILQQEYEFRTLIENSPDVITRYDLECRRIYVNPMMQKLLGRPLKEIVGKKPSEFSPVPQEMEIEKKILHAINTGDEIVTEVDFVRPDGIMGYGHLRILPECDDNGNVMSALTIGRDISERKKMENTLAEKEYDFRTLAENSPNIIIRYNTKCEQTYVNHAYTLQTGISREDALNTKPEQQWKDSLNIIAMSIEEYQTRVLKVIETGISDILTIAWYKLSDHQYVAYEFYIVAEKDINGNIKGALAIGHDITKHQELENNLNKTLLQLEQFINNIPEMAWIKDFENRFIMANKVILETLRISSVDEIIGKDVYDIFPDTQANICSTNDNIVKQKGLPLRTEEYFEIRKGKTIWVEIIRTPFKNSEGTVIGTIGTARDITERKKAQQRIDFMAHHDALTRLPNRILAKQKTEQLILKAKKMNSKIALIFVDLDEFKSINDTLGHSFGDILLKIVALRLQKSLNKNSFVSRQGGDEFLIIIPDIQSVNEILPTLKNILNLFEKPFIIKKEMLFTSISMGISLFPEHGTSFETLLQNADNAMYKAKESGKNTFSFFTEQMNHHLVGQFKMQNDLKKALSNNEFQLHYQPQVDIRQNRIIGAEALIRWQHPQLGMIPPLQFISLAESCGLIIPLGEWVINEACRQASHWNQQGIFVTIAVNISAVQFKRGDLLNTIMKALNKSNLHPSMLELELTESILMNDAEQILKSVHEFKKLGIQLSIDDFGTGYSSLAYLKRFAVDKLKIDRSFIRDILDDKEDATIVKTIIQMAKSLKLKTIAEGVECQNTLEILQSYACDEIQGYFFSKPLEAQEFEKFYKEYG